MREKNVRAELRRQMEEVKQDMKMKVIICVCAGVCVS